MPLPQNYYLPSTKPWYRRWWGKVLIILLGIFLIFCFAIAFSTLNLVRQLHGGQINLNDLNSPTAGPTTVTTAISADSPDSPYLGDPTAPVTIVEFADFNCPSSKLSVPVLKQLFQLYPGQLRIVFRHLPILDDSSSLAAQAAACAGNQGNLLFWAYHDQLFNQQGSFTETSLIKIATDLGLKVDAFTACLQNQDKLLKVAADAAAAGELGAVGTPTFFINDNKVIGHQPLANWQKAIDYLLENQK